MLRALASGRSVAEGLGLTVGKGAPKSDARSQRAWDVAVLVRPIQHGGGGKKVVEALAAVAAAHGVTAETVRKDWNSVEGKKVRALAEELYNPSELPL